MKVLKYIGLTLLVIVIIGCLFIGGWAFGNWLSSQKAPATANNSGNSASTGGGSTPVTPAKPTVDQTCNTDELTLTTADNGLSGAGTLSFNLVFTNSGSRECILYGYPGVSFVNANGNQVGAPASRVTNATEKTQTLKPGAQVAAAVYYSEAGNFDAGTCQTGATKIRVYPPNDVGYLSVAAPTDSRCPGFEIAPVAAI